MVNKQVMGETHFHPPQARFLEGSAQEKDAAQAKGRTGHL